MGKFKISTPSKKFFVWHGIHGWGYIYSMYQNMFDQEITYEVVFNNANIHKCFESDLIAIEDHEKQV